MHADTSDTLSLDVVDYVEGISDPKKVQLSKRWDRDRERATSGPRASDCTDLYEVFSLQPPNAQDVSWISAQADYLPYLSLISFHLKQWTRWSFTIPTDCMYA